MTLQVEAKLLLSRRLWAVSLCHGVWQKEDEEGGGGGWGVWGGDSLCLIWSSQALASEGVGGSASAVSASERSLSGCNVSLMTD